MRYGYNGWCGSKETTMKRYTPPAPKMKLKSKAALAAGVEAEEQVEVEEVVKVSGGGEEEVVVGQVVCGART